MRNKKIIFSIVMFAVSVLFLSKSVNAAATNVGEGTEGDFNYTIYSEDGSYWVELTGYTGTSVEPTIPTKVESKYPVKKLGSWLFTGTKIEKITIPSNITNINSYAFAYATSLNSITFSEGLVSIGDSAFLQCMSLTTINLPKTLTTIENAAFSECINLNEVSLPNSLKILGQTDYKKEYGVFYNCDSLKEITIPKTITKANNAFSNCDNLVKVTIETGMTALPDRLFEDTTNYNLEVLMPNTITSIGDKSFYNSWISTLTLPQNLKKIGNNAFSNCPNLSSLDIPVLVWYIGSNAFVNWTESQTINFDYKEEYEEWDMFWDENTSAIIKYGTRGTPFKDVKLSSWYFLATEYCYNNNIINGTSSTKFSPNLKVTRGMLVTMLYAMAGIPEVNSNCKFTDVSASKYYYNAITWASENNIVNGYAGTTKFGPDDYVTREQLAVMLSSFARYNKKYTSTNYGLNKFLDSDKVSGWALSAVRWAVKNRIINGSNGNINPKGDATRAEVVTMIYSYCLNID